MNLDKPHDIISAQELRRLPKAKQARYRPLPDPAKKILDAMTPDQRAGWLARQPELTSMDRMRIKRASDKRRRKHEARTIHASKSRELIL